MNWQMTRPGEVIFRKGEPFAFLTLMEHKRLEDVEPIRKRLSTNPDLVKNTKPGATAAPTSTPASKAANTTP